MARNSGLLVCIAVAGCATVSGNDGPSNVADAEIAFARDAQVRTVNEAFISAFAPDGIMFRPTPISAQRLLAERPYPASTALVWTPTIAETAASADLAVTTGPAQWGTRGSQATGSGYFLSVWRKNGKRWQVVLDAGIEGPIPGSVDIGVGTLSVRTLRPSPARSDDIDQMRNDLMFNERSLIEDYPNLMREFAASDVRVYRDGKAPSGTIADAMNLISREDDVEWTPQAAFVSKSGDLGYTYGLAKGDREAGYMRVWRNQNGNWKVAYDLR